MSTMYKYLKYSKTLKCIAILTCFEVENRRKQKVAYCVSNQSDEKDLSPTTPPSSSSSNKCDKYNTFYQRLSWHSRTERCNNDRESGSGCKFKGRGAFGKCLLIPIVGEDASHQQVENALHPSIKQAVDPTFKNISSNITNNNSNSISTGGIKSSTTSMIGEDGKAQYQINHVSNQTNKVSQPSTTTPASTNTDDDDNKQQDSTTTMNKDVRRLFQDMLELDANIKENLKRMVEIESSISTESRNKLHTIINEQITSSAVDQIRDSQEAAHTMAKELLLDVLQDPDTPHKFGILLTSICSFETVLLPTRELIYWSILLPSTVDNTFHLTKTQVIDYWLNHSDGRPITHNALVDFSHWWLSHPDIMLPLIKWSLEQREMVVEPISHAIVTACQSKQVKETVKVYLKRAVIESLKSPQFKEMAKERIVEYIKLTTNEDVNSGVIVTDTSNPMASSAVNDKKRNKLI